MSGVPRLRSTLLTTNPNSASPFRLGHNQASTCDQNHNYGAEQSAFDQGLMEKFPETVGVSESAFCDVSFSYGHLGGALVNGLLRRQHGDRDVELRAGIRHERQLLRHHVRPVDARVVEPCGRQHFSRHAFRAAASAKIVNPTGQTGTLDGDLDPTGDICSAATTVRMGGLNVGDLLNAKGISWGSFMGGLDLTITNPDGSTGCKRQSPASPSNNGPTADYIAHHAFFQ